jgi:hypothetical protein
MAKLRKITKKTFTTPLGRPVEGKRARPEALFVCVPTGERDRLDKYMVEVSYLVKRHVSVSQYVRAALAYAYDHKAEILERLGSASEQP